MKSEDKVILGAIIAGIGGGVALFFLKTPAIMISIFLAMGIAALVYRFLGGIPQDTSLPLKVMKLGGTLGALIGTALIINPILEKQLSVSFDELFSPSPNRWVAIGVDTSRPVAVAINKVGIKREGKYSSGTTIEANPGALQHANLKIVEEDDQWRVKPLSESTESFVLGKLDRRGLQNSGLFSGIDPDASACYITPKLGPSAKIAGNDLDRMRSRGFVFDFGTGLFDEGRSGFIISDPLGQNPGQVKDSLFPGQGSVFQFGGQYYVIILLGAVHQGPDPFWAQFAFLKINPAIN